MTHRERLEAAWSFRAPDRVPIEMGLTPLMQADPRSTRLSALVAEHADNFIGVPGPSFGFFGLVSTGSDEVIIEERAGEYTHIRHRVEATVGYFTAITHHPEGNEDYHWEKRYITSLDELRLLANAPREPLTYDMAAWQAAVAEVGESGLPISYLAHPLGNLVRHATMEDVYTWLYDEPATVHRYLAVVTAQLVDVLERMLRAGMGPYFVTYAHEMFIPPWMGVELYDEFVMPYDRQLGEVISLHGGKWRAHCHGNCMDYLERFLDCGITAVEPLEIPPTGNVDLAEAKRRVGGRMLLSGNIPSERFVMMSPAQVREQVKAAIDQGAPGGGFTLATSNGHGLQCSEEQMAHTIACCEAYIEAGLEFGSFGD